MGRTPNPANTVRDARLTDEALFGVSLTALARETGLSIDRVRQIVHRTCRQRNPAAYQALATCHVVRGRRIKSVPLTRLCKHRVDFGAAIDMTQGGN